MTSKKSTSSHTMTGDYVILMETNEKECESWYYFIRKQGNEENLSKLKNDLEKIDWYSVKDLSIFDIDLDNVVSPITAKEMSLVEVNSKAYHRKFDGVLQEIDFGFTTKDLKKNKRMMEKVFDLLGYGMIQDFIDDEDIEDDQLRSTSDDDSSDSGTSSGSGSDSSEDSESSEDSDSETNKDEDEVKDEDKDENKDENKDEDKGGTSSNNRKKHCKKPKHTFKKETLVPPRIRG